ncbi:unnamed protein product, partial [Mesorhabditis belari]|uniref:Protein pellino n=1 Tax=Mesorhabditis belari TaxID=2138241 RepID=A0AAF3EFU0_9BILA
MDDLSLESANMENLYSEQEEPQIPTGPLIDDDGKYGELILLGYNGTGEGNLRHGSKKQRSKFVLMRRTTGNGIKKMSTSSVAMPPKDAPAVLDKDRHVVSYAYKSHTILVEYSMDPNKDMFQIGRSSEDQIDFTIVDTWLVSGVHNSSHGGKSHKNEKDTRPISSTISRYACRILVDRDNCNKAYLYAAGFDGKKNIFLGEKATKWSKVKSSEMDGLTTNGVLILHPNRNTEDGSEDDEGAMYVWREVSVDGDMFTLRETRSSNTKGELMLEETSMLQDGTLIDLCGATLLYRTADGLARSPTERELNISLDRLNAGKPQCPVNLNTLVIPRKKTNEKDKDFSRQPYVYLRCGHVQGKHDWGLQVSAGGTRTTHKCPVCLIESERVLSLTMGMESAFHIDSGVLDYAFNPCGHVASLSTVRYWSRIPLPHGTNSFHPVCPFCTSLLASKKPYVRLIFQDHLGI